MINKHLSIKVSLAISVTIILWASAFVGIRAALPDYPPIELAAFRYIVASVVLIPFAYYRKIKLPKSEDIVCIAFTAFFGFTLYNIVLNYGEQLVTAASACFIVNGGNLITAILGALVLKEQVTPATWLGMIVSLFGIGIISWGEASSFIIINSGSFLILLAAFSQSMYFILQKSLLLRYSSFELICYAIWIGTLALLPLSGNLVESIQLSSVQSTLSIIYLGIFPAVVAYFCWSYVLSCLDASTAAVYLFLVPIVTLLIGYLWLKEIPSLLAIIGGLLTISGIIIAKYSKIILAKPKESC